MIVVYTSYDMVSGILGRFADDLIQRAGSRISRTLGPTNASGSNLQAILETNAGIALFFFGHGMLAPPALVGQDKLPAIDCKSDHLLAGRLVYATTCHSSEILANSVKRYKSTVLGYKGKLYVALISQYESLMKGCMLSGALALLSGRNAGEALDCMQKEFHSAAGMLIAGSIQDQVMAVQVFERNALAVTLEGDGQRIL